MTDWTGCANKRLDEAEEARERALREKLFGSFSTPFPK